MVVRPGGTPLLRAASALGLEAIPGEAMLVPAGPPPVQALDGAASALKVGPTGLMMEPI